MGKFSLGVAVGAFLVLAAGAGMAWANQSGDAPEAAEPVTPEPAAETPEGAAV